MSGKRPDRRQRPVGGSDSPGLIDRFVPEPDVRTRHDVEVRAPADLVFEVAEAFDLFSVRTIRAIFGLRAHLLGASPPDRSDLDGLVLRLKQMGWQELARREDRELVMGAAVQPWLPEPEFEPIPPGRFVDYAEPERVKIAWTLEAIPLGPTRTRFGTETRVLATDPAGREAFRRYWRFARFGIVAIRWFLLPAVRKEAETLAAARRS